MIFSENIFIIAHLIGDYVFQTDWMAKGKKVSSWICTVHVLAYILPFLFIGLAWWQLLLISGQHWIQDRTNIVKWWMHIAGQKDFASPPMAPWSIILIDNTGHLVWIILVIWFGGYMTSLGGL